MKRGGVAYLRSVAPTPARYPALNFARERASDPALKIAGPPGWYDEPSPLRVGSLLSVRDTGAAGGSGNSGGRSGSHRFP
jgi:hypothetical protein